MITLKTIKNVALFSVGIISIAFLMNAVITTYVDEFDITRVFEEDIRREKKNF